MDAGAPRRRGGFLLTVNAMSRVHLRRDATSRLLIAVTIALFNAALIYAAESWFIPGYKPHPEYGAAALVTMLASAFYDLLRRWDAINDPGWRNGSVGMAEVTVGSADDEHRTRVQGRPYPWAQRGWCSCGWRGRWRRSKDAGWQATADAEDHHV